MDDLDFIPLYRLFEYEFGIDRQLVTDAISLHKDLLDISPFDMKSPYLLAAVCVYVISRQMIRPITLKEISNVSHIKRADIARCYRSVLKEIILEMPLKNEDRMKWYMKRSDSKKSDRFSEEDIQLVCQQAGVSEEQAKKALVEANGDLARAILLLTTK